MFFLSDEPLGYLLVHLLAYRAPLDGEPDDDDQEVEEHHEEQKDVGQQSEDGGREVEDRVQEYGSKQAQKRRHEPTMDDASVTSNSGVSRMCSSPAELRRTAT